MEKEQIIEKDLDAIYIGNVVVKHFCNTYG